MGEIIIIWNKEKDDREKSMKNYLKIFPHEQIVYDHSLKRKYDV